MPIKRFIRSATHHPGPSIWRRLLGWTCILIGIPGLILPILPGIPLVIFGIVLLSREHHWAHRLVVWGKSRLPVHFKHLDEHPPNPPPDRNKPAAPEEP